MTIHGSRRRFCASRRDVPCRRPLRTHRSMRQRSNPRARQRPALGGASRFRRGQASRFMVAGWRLGSCSLFIGGRGVEAQRPAGPGGGSSSSRSAHHRGSRPFPRIKLRGAWSASTTTGSRRFLRAAPAAFWRAGRAWEPGTAESRPKRAPLIRSWRMRRGLRRGLSTVGLTVDEAKGAGRRAWLAPGGRRAKP